MAIWFTLILVVASFIATALLAPKPQIEDRRPDGLDDLDFPQSKEGTPVGYLLGKARQRGPNTLWYGDFKPVPIKEKIKTGIFSSETKIVGYKYYVGFALGLCLGPNVHLRRIWIDKDEVWSGDAGPGETTININKPNLFGGPEQGGGFVATARFYGGSFNQLQNAYMVSKVPDETPAYVGQAYIVFEHAYIGKTAQLRPMSFELERYPDALGLNSSIRLVGEDLNPSEALYDVLTNDWGGLGEDPNDVDIASLVSNATTLKNEGNGISLLVNRANTGEGILKEILRQIDGVMFTELSTGKVKLKLIRQDYDPLSLPVLNQSNVPNVKLFSRSSWEDTYNQVRVFYKNRNNKYEDGVAIAQDMANINAQGRIKSMNISFPGVTTPALAQKLATRELNQISVPLYNASIEINRLGAALRPGDPFSWSSPEHNISSAIMRMLRLDLGELANGTIVAEIIQDKFAANPGIYANPGDTLWDPIDQTAVAIPNSRLFETPFWLLTHQDVVIIPPADGNTYGMALARQPNPNMLGFSGYHSQDNWANRVLGPSKGLFTNTALVQTAITATQGLVNGLTSITINGLSPGDFVLLTATSSEIQNEGKNLFVIDNEIFAYESFTNNGGGSYTLNNVHRALLDTEYEPHSQNTVIWFLSNIDGLIHAEFLGTTQIKSRFLSFSTRDSFDFDAASDVLTTPNRRFERPLPPDYITVNGSRLESHSIPAGLYTIAWRHRSRTDYLIRFEDAASQPLEPGQIHDVFIYNNEVLVASSLDVQTTSVDLNFSAGPNRVEVESRIIGGLVNYKRGKYSLTVT